MPANSQLSCIICNSPPATTSTLLCCSRCKSSLYCSKPCQRADWRVHKILCASRAEFETPPHKNARRGICFDVESGDITFTWETIKMKHDDDDGTSWESADLQHHFGAAHPHPQIYHNNVPRDRKLKENIMLWFIDDFLVDGSSPNKAVMKAVPEMTLGGGAVWCGPLIAMKDTNSYYDEKRMFINSTPGVGHMDMADLTDVVDYLSHWRRVSNEPPEVSAARQQAMLDEILGRNTSSSTTDPSPKPNPKPNPSPGPGPSTASKKKKKASRVLPAERTKPSPQRETTKRIRGVRINCLADTKAGRPQFEETEHTVTTNSDHFTTPLLASRLGLPLQLRKVAPPTAWQYDSYKLQNPTVTFMHLSIDPNSSQFGWAPHEWDECVGSVFVTRIDGKELRAGHVELLCHYCRFFLQPYFEDSMGSGMDPESFIGRDEVMYHISPKSFELFCSGFCSYQQNLGNKMVARPDIVSKPAQVKGLKENFHKLKEFL